MTEEKKVKRDLAYDAISALTDTDLAEEVLRKDFAIQFRGNREGNPYRAFFEVSKELGHGSFDFAVQRKRPTSEGHGNVNPITRQLRSLHNLTAAIAEKLGVEEKSAADQD